jgi:hypothetical protein
LHYLANLTPETLHEELETHKNESSTPEIDNTEVDAWLTEEVLKPKAKISAKKRRKEKRNKKQARIKF